MRSRVTYRRVVEMVVKQLSSTTIIMDLMIITIHPGSGDFRTPIMGGIIMIPTTQICISIPEDPTTGA